MIRILAPIYLLLASTAGICQLSDSVSSKLKGLSTNQEKANFLFEAGLAISNPNESLPYLEAAREISGVTDSLKIAILSRLGSNYMFLFQNDSSLSILNSALASAKKSKFTFLIADIYNGLGSTAKNLSQNEQAIKHYISGLKTINNHQSEQAELLKITLTGNIAGVYYDLEQYEDALNYALQSKNLIYKNEVEHKYMIANLMMAFSYRALNNVDSALKYNNQVLEIARTDDTQSYYLPHALYNTASILRQKSETTKAKKLFKEAIAVSNAQGEHEVKVSCIITLGQISLDENQPREALIMAIEAKEIARENTFLTKLVEAMEIEVQARESLNQFEMSLNAYKELAVLKDSLYNVETVSKIEDINTKYQTDIKESEIAQLSAENKVQKLQAEQDRQTRLILTIVVLALIIIALLFYSRFRSKAKSNALLDAKNQELAKLNQTKDRLFSIISHDLKSPLSSFHTITKSLTDNWEQLEKDQLKSFIESLRDSSATVRDMMDNLLKWALAQTDQLEYKSETVDITSILTKVQQQLKNISDLKQIRWNTEIKSQHKVLADSQFMEIVIRNILSNALKFSEMESEIGIALEGVNDKQVITISDHGIGMDQSEIDKLIKGEIVAQDIQNSPEKGTGLGLTLCTELMSKMKAQMEITSAKNKGTTFKLIFDQAA